MFKTHHKSQNGTNNYPKLSLPLEEIAINYWVKGHIYLGNVQRCMIPVSKAFSVQFYPRSVQGVSYSPFTVQKLIYYTLHNFEE